MNKVKLSECVKVCIGQGAPQDTKDFSIKGNPFIRAGSLDLLTSGGSLDRLEFISTDSAKKNKLKLYPIGSVVFAKSGMSATKNRVYKLSRPCYVVNHLAILLPNEKIDSNYLCLVMQFVKPSTMIKDFSYPSIGQNDIENFKIPLPPLDDQIRIADILTRAENLIAKRKESIKALDELLKSTFLEMFGDPVRNEKGWDRVTIRDLILEAKYGTSKSAEGGKYKYFRMNNITNEGYWDFSNIKYIDIDDFDKDKYLLKNGDIVFNRTNSKELVGKTAVYNNDEEVIIAGYLIRIRTNADANPWYIWGYLNSKQGKLRLFNLCRNIVGMANINAQELQDIPILKPPINLQNQFATIVEKVESLKAKYQQNLDELEKLYGSLSQQAFSGEMGGKLYPTSPTESVE